MKKESRTIIEYRAVLLIINDGSTNTKKPLESGFFKTLKKVND